MKIRNGFVSNSSSSSFVLSKRDMSDIQILKFSEFIENHKFDETYISETQRNFLGRKNVHDDVLWEFLDSIEVKRALVDISS